MKFEIIESELVNTGGWCMVLYSKIELLDEGRTVYASTSEESSAIYATEDGALDSFPENAISEFWFYSSAKHEDRFDEIHNSLRRLYRAKEYYQRRKRGARREAISWQNHFGESEHYNKFSLIEWQEYFEKLGKRYGLLEEFRENGII